MSFDPCIAAQTEIEAMTQWSQAQYQLKLYMWANGCPGAEPPVAEGPGANWANNYRGFPPLSYTYPGDPSDRHPPGG